MDFINYLKNKAASLAAGKEIEKQTAVNRRATLARETVRKPLLQSRQDIADWQHAKYINTLANEPKTYLLQDIYNNIAGDALLTSQVNNRKEQTISAPFEMINGDGTPDEKMTAIIRELPVIPDIISHILDSEYYGYSLIELSSDQGNKRVDLINRRNVVPDFGRFYKDTSFNNYVEYKTAAEFGRWLLEFNADHCGLLDKAVPHVLFKKFAESCWSQLCEIYGIPPRVMKTNTADPAMLAQAENMMREIGAAAWFIIDTTEQFEFANAVNTNGDVYNNLINLCNNEISMLVSGAIVGQDTKNGNESKEKVSMGILDRLVYADKRMVEMYFNTLVIPALYKIHWIPATASIFRFSLAEDIDKLFEMTVKIMPHKKVADAFIKDKFGIDVTGDRFEQPAGEKGNF